MGSCISSWVVAACLLGGGVPSIEGFLEPHRKLELSPAEPGVLSELHVREGDSIAAGQIVAGLERDALIVGRELAAAQLAGQGRRQAAEAEWKLRRARVAKLSELFERGHASQEELDRAQAECDVAAGRLREIEEQRILDEWELKRAEALVERRVIRSPIAGVVTRVHRELQEFVTAASPVVVSIVQLYPLRATLPLSPRQASGLSLESRVPLEIVELERVVTARVESIAPLIDAESGTVRVRLVVEPTETGLQPGLRCRLGEGFLRDEIP